MIIFQTCESRNRATDLEKIINQQDKIISERINTLEQKVTTATVKLFTYDTKLSKIDQGYKSLAQRLKANGDHLKELQSSVSFTKEQMTQQGQSTPPEQVIVKDTVDLNSALRFVGTT